MMNDANHSHTDEEDQQNCCNQVDIESQQPQTSAPTDGTNDGIFRDSSQTPSAAANAINNNTPWLMTLGAVVGVLCVTQIATLILTARLTSQSSQTEVDPTTGVLHLQGNHQPVVVVSKGETHIFTVLDEDERQACVDVNEFVEMWAHTVQGEKVNAVVRTVEPWSKSVGRAESVSFVTAPNTKYNDTHACLQGNDGHAYCSTFEPCGEGFDKLPQDTQNDNDNNNRRLEEHQQFRRTLFHKTIQRKLWVDIDMGDPFSPLIDPCGGDAEDDGSTMRGEQNPREDCSDGACANDNNNPPPTFPKIVINLPW